MEGILRQAQYRNKAYPAKPGQYLFITYNTFSFLLKISRCFQASNSYNYCMLVYEFKLRGKPEQFAAIDEAIRTVQFIRNKAIRFWMDHRGTGKYDLSKLA